MRRTRRGQRTRRTQRGQRTKQDRMRAVLRGRIGEALCRWILRFKGYRILEAAYRTRVGEIDILARRGQVLVAVEVKVRPNRTAARLAITPRQRRRIERALEWYLHRHPEFATCTLRFDLFAVAPWRLPSHNVNAWWPGD